MANQELILKLRAEVADAKRQLQEVNKQLKAMGIGASGTTRQVDGLRTSLAGLARYLLPVFGFTALTRGAITATKEFMSFDQAMREVWTVAGDLTQVGFVRLSEDVAALAGSLGVDKIEAAGAAYEIFSRSTKDVREVLIQTNIAAQASIAGLVNMREAAILLVSATNAFESQGADLRTTFDAMFKAVDIGGVTFRGLAGSLGMLAPVAAKVNVTMDEMLAALAFVTNQGVREEIAITALRTALSQMVNPSEELTTLAKKYGIELGTAGLKTQGFTGILEKLNRLYQVNPQLIATMFPEQRALVAILGLAGDKTGEFTRLLGEMAQKTGAGKEAYEKMAGGLTISTKQMSTEFSNLKDEIIKLFEPDAGSWAEYWAENFRLLTGAIREFKAEILAVINLLKTVATWGFPSPALIPARLGATALYRADQWAREKGEELGITPAAKVLGAGAREGLARTINIFGPVVAKDLSDLDVTEAKSKTAVGGGLKIYR